MENDKNIVTVALLVNKELSLFAEMKNIFF